MFANTQIKELVLPCNALAHFGLVSQTHIMEFEMFGQFVFDPLNGRLALRDNDASVTLTPNPDTVVRLDQREAHLFEYLVQLDVPHPSCLLQTIY